MAYEINDGADGQVQNNPYCMEKSFNAKNTKSMNQEMGYHEMADLANSKAPMDMPKATPANAQKGPMAANSKNNDAKGSAY